MVDERNSLCKKVLILADREFLYPGHCETFHEKGLGVDSIISTLIENGFAVEIEETIDCITENYYRTGNNKFDAAIYISKRSIDDFWGGLGPNFFSKINDGGVFIDVFSSKSEKEISELYSGEVAQLFSNIDIIPENKIFQKEFAIDYLFQELIQAMEEENLLRMDMLFRILLRDKKFEVRKLLGSLDSSPKPEVIANRIVKILANHPEMPQIDDSFVEKFGLNKDDIDLMKLAIVASKINNFGNIVQKSESIKSLSKNLFLECNTSFSGKVMLNLCITGKRFGAVSNSWIIRNNWMEDEDILEHWTINSPTDEESWQLFSRHLWNKKLKLECAEVAKRGLKYHPDSANLLRRKAHGLRIESKHEEAIEIEKTLLKSTKLSQLDTLIYLVRSYYALEKWQDVLHYITQGLEIKPDLEEFDKKKIAAQEFITNEK